MTADDRLNAWRESFLAEFGFTEDEREALDEAARYHRDTTTHPPQAARAGYLPLTDDRIPPRYAAALPAHPEVLGWMAELARSAIATRRVIASLQTGPSRLLLGVTGTGKTHEAYGVIRGMAVLGLRTRWRFTTVADLYARLRPRHGVDSEAVFEEYAGTSLLVVDDLGAAKPSEWTEEVNFRLVNHRYESVLPTLFASNLLPGDLGDVLGGRVASRLNEMTEGAAGRISLKGKDRRYAA